jgi:hypothetical protein
MNCVSRALLCAISAAAAVDTQKLAPFLFVNSPSLNFALLFASSLSRCMLLWTSCKLAMLLLPLLEPPLLLPQLLLPLLSAPIAAYSSAISLHSSSLGVIPSMAVSSGVGRT